MASLLIPTGPPELPTTEVKSHKVHWPANLTPETKVSDEAPDAEGDKASAQDGNGDNYDNDDDDDEDDEDEVDSQLVMRPRKPHTPSQRKVEAMMASENFLEDAAKKKARQDSEKEDKDSHKIEHHNMSTVAITQASHGERIIDKRREYQTELFERAKRKNSIIVLDTGTGKTLIAVSLLQHILEDEVNEREGVGPRAKRHKKTAFFLVDKVALVYQQWAVLRGNIDYPVKSFCGDSVISTWSKDFWEKQFDEAMAIVCTAEILYKCLHHSYIQMKDINLLIFDEAHHAKKNHPYARIVKDFYYAEDRPECRPRILGMTASPVDVKTDIEKASAELERLLHSEIVTATIDNSKDFKRYDKLALFPRVSPPAATPLCKQLRSIIGSNTLFEDVFVCAEEATSELGVWCADHLWEVQLSKIEAEKYAARTEGMITAQLGQGDDVFLSDEVNRETARIEEAQSLVQAHPSPPLNRDPTHISPKVEKLLQVLDNHFKEDKRSRCVIFVDKRYKATLLVDLLRQNNARPRYLVPDYLIGIASSDSGAASMSQRDMVTTVSAFRNGTVNCLVATSVAEEGLDIPSCNIIIRFDLYKTVIQYIQSRGRARQKKSTYYHMAEIGNVEHSQTVRATMHEQESLKLFCNLLPEKKRIKLENYDDDVQRETRSKVYRVPTTKATLNYKSALECLANFVSSLPHTSATEVPPPQYAVTSVGEQFQAEVLLPPQSPIRKAVGDKEPRKAVAKCSAAFNMCLELRRKRYLDDYLRPIFTKRLPALRNAQLSISSKTREQYPMHIKPDIWSSAEDLGSPERLHMMVISLANPESLGRKSRPLGLLTRDPLPPNIPPPRLFFGHGRSSIVVLSWVEVSLQPTETQLETMHAFTLRIFKDIFSKEYEATVGQMPYFLVPMTVGHDAPLSAVEVPEDCGDLIDWESLKFVHSNESQEWKDQPESFFQEKYIVDRHSGKRKFYLEKLRPDMKPTDMVPEDVEPPPSRTWKARDAVRDIRLYSNSLWVRSLSQYVYIEDQPVVEAEIIPLRLNMVNPSIQDDDSKSKMCYLILQPLMVSALPVDVVAMAYCFPVIIHRIDSALIAMDGCKACGLDILPDLALESFTKDSDNSEEHGKTQVNFQAGMGKNYERLEFLGDCFLKMATTIAIHTRYPESNEFESHCSRMALLCNQTLFHTALDLKLERYIRSRQFDRRSWYPVGLTLKRGKKGELNDTHDLADKSIADVCEALIGAAYLTSYGNNNFDLAVQAVTTFTNSPDHRMTKYDDYWALYEKPTWQTDAATGAQKTLARDINERIGYEFKCPRLARVAFMHPSYQHWNYENLPSYQRLEFLGDALYDMVCVDDLFFRFPNADPQWLTEHKMAMVSNQFLGCLAVNLGFDKHLKSFSTNVQSLKQAYVEDAERGRERAVEEAVKQGKGPDGYARDFWMDVSQPPKSLPDTVEAFIGAIFIDSGYDFSVVQRFYKEFVRHYFEDMSIYDTYANKQPVTFLANTMGQFFRCASWRVVITEVASGALEEEKEGMEFDGEVVQENTDSFASMGKKKVAATLVVHGMVRQYAVAGSGRYAKIAVAKKGLNMLTGLTRTKYGPLFGCDCKMSGQRVVEGDVPFFENQWRKLNQEQEGGEEGTGGEIGVVGGDRRRTSDGAKMGRGEGEGEDGALRGGGEGPRSDD